ncbi:uncharacterized protein F4817DRAFT_316328 [Daldinia loculata]|uniref:uncharacterized protein n=1 Tax=Daldinia loculata TaxID=103429 RepID=UPI0020C51947|nr:uncharacterized protein F4817DRAFT_316328 [Daldinia loculata]KAI1646927.1 hypothetical protein F4817DRAFT_316328 [Daldinia loculata]
MSSSHGRSIGQYYLTRDSFGNEPLWLDEMQEYMEVDNATDTNTWETLFIRWGARTVTSYSVSLPNFAYVVHSVAMSNMPRPRMKHRDVIVDNYRAAGGNLATFQRIGVSFINNTSAYDCIEAAFAARGLQFPDMGSMVINLPLYGPSGVLRRSSEPNSTGWSKLFNGNPFLEGQQKMLREYSREFNNARIKKVTIAAHEKFGMIDMNLLLMVTHLTRDGGVIQAAPQEEPLPETQEKVQAWDWDIGNF